MNARGEIEAKIRRKIRQRAKRTLKLSGTMLRTRITSNMLLFSSSVACQRNPGIRDKGACEATENKRDRKMKQNKKT